MANPVPTMTTKGWLHEPNEKAQHLMGLFMMARPTQSKTFDGQISSMSELILKYGKSPNALCDHTQIVLTTLFSRYFDSVDVLVTEKPMPGETSENGRFQIQIQITAIEGNARINLMEGAEIGNNAFKRIVELVNSGGESWISI